MASGLDMLAPAGYGWAITPDDNNDLAYETRAIFVGTGGNIKIDMYDPTTKKRTAVTFKNIPSGTFMAVKTLKIYATVAATAAADIVALA